MDKVKLVKSRCLRLWEITSIVDHRPVNCQVIKYFLGDKPEETEMAKEGVTPRAARGSEAAVGASAMAAVTSWVWRLAWGTVG